MKNILLFVVVLMLVSACTSEIPFNPKESEVPVVNCILTKDTVQTLSITQSAVINGSYLFKEIRDAKAELFYADSVKIGDFERVSYDNMELKYTTEINKKYTLKVTLPNGQILSATTTMPASNQFVADNAKDIGSIKHFRQLTAESPTWVFVLGDRELSSDLMHPKPSPNATMKGTLGTDHSLVDRFNADGDMSDINPASQTPAYYIYLHFLSSPNMTDPIHFCIENVSDEFAYVFFRTASAEYDRYFKSSLSKAMFYQSEDDPVQWFDESIVYSNIEGGGVGIFAAYYDRQIYYFDGLTIGITE